MRWEERLVLFYLLTLEGVDPLLRSRVWEYLRTLARDEGVTVIITTHYIEEARSADRVGMMRDGQYVYWISNDLPLSIVGCWWKDSQIISFETIRKTH